VEQVADLAPRPQGLDESLVARRLLWELDLVDELAALLVGVAGQRQGAGAVTAVAPEDDKLSTVEQVRQLRRVHFGYLYFLRAGELEVGQDGVADLAVEPANLDLDVLLRTDVGADRARLVSELVEQSGVDIVADAEGEDARAGGVAVLDVLEDLLRVALADGRLAVGEEDNGKVTVAAAGTHVDRPTQPLLQSR